MKKTVLKTAMVCLLTCSALMSQAAIRRPAPRPPARPPIRHAAPFDGGVTMLIGAAILFGVKKAYDRRNEGRLV